MKKLRAALPLLALPFLLGRPVAATTYMQMPDQALADQAAAVADVKVVSFDVAPIEGAPATDYLVEINRVLKGDIAGSTILVRVPGGFDPATGVGLKIWGAPEFAPGEDAILFLRPAGDGSYRILHLMLGAFHKRQMAGRTVALRDLSEAREVGKSEIEDGLDAIRDYEAFSDWVADRAERIPSQQGYVVGQAKAQLASASEKYTLMTHDDGKAIRWFRFDGSQSVEWRVHSGGQPGLGEAATVEAFRAAMNVWNEDPGTDIRYVLAGTTDAAGGLVRSDDENTILFDDPNRDNPAQAVEGHFTCEEGGVIAIGGPYFFTSTRAFRSQRYHEAAEADIVTNDGTECLFANNPPVAQEVFAHELGHTLGLGHSKTRDALMFANVHNDGRGALLTDDDRAAVAELYGNGSSGNGNGNGGSAKLVAPAKFTAKATSRTEATLTWRDKSTGEDGYYVEIKQKGAAKFLVIESLAPDTGSVQISDLLPGKTYTFRVRAYAGNRFSPYSRALTVTMPR
jgi:hypothetical protein